jgi:hypothetical protein
MAAFGQRVGVVAPRGVNSNAYARPNTFGSVSGFGNVVFPGTGHAPTSITDPGFGARLGATVSGYPAYTGVPVGGGRGRGNRPVVYVPYAAGFPTYYGEPSEPQVTPYPQQQMAPPPVVINQYFTSETARPVVREYAREYTDDGAGGIRVYAPPASAPAPADENPTYLIAFKDHTIYAALAYWVEGDTLHYVTNQNTHNQVSLDLVDRELSERLNRERTIDFKIPPARR